MHPTIIQRRIKVRMKQGSNRSIMHSNIITLMWTTNRLLLTLRWWFHILGLTWLLLLLLSSSFLFIFGQKFFKTWPCLTLGGTLRFTGRTGQTGLGTGQTGQTAIGSGQTGRLAVGFFSLPCPPPSVEVFIAAREVLFCSTFLSGLSSPMITFFLLSIRLDLAELKPWDSSIQAHVYALEKESGQFALQI